MQYVVGNPLFALQMTRHDVRAGLYAPLRLFVYETEDGRVFVEHDLPSSLFGQFRHDHVTPAAQMLDRKMEELIASAG